LLLARRYDRFPKFDVAAAIVDTASIQAPNLLLASMFGPSTVGFYALADRVLAMPTTLLGQAIGQVLFAHSPTAVAEGRIDRMLLQTIGGLFALMIVPTAIMFFFGPQLFGAVFGSTWTESGVFAGWLTAGATIQLLYASISYALLATEGQHLNLYIHIFMLVGKVAAIWYGFTLGSPLVAVVGYSVVNGTGYLAAIAVVFMHTRNYGLVRLAKG
jgi:O-antigen/teichoic acid export membrane protein